MGDLEEEMGEGELDTWSRGAAVRASLPQRSRRDGGCARGPPPRPTTCARGTTAENIGPRQNPRCAPQGPCGGEEGGQGGEGMARITSRNSSIHEIFSYDILNFVIELIASMMKIPDSS